MAEAAPILDELLECSLCMNTFVEPLSLRCLHSFCRQCLEKYKKSENSSVNIICPLCRAVCRSDEITKDFFKHQLIELHASAKKRKSELCKRHPDEEVIRFCETCSVSICSECLTEGKHVGKKHVLRKNDELYKQISSRLDSCQKKVSKLLSQLKGYDEKTKVFCNIKALVESREKEILRLMKEEKEKLFATLDEHQSSVPNRNENKIKRMEENFKSMLESITCALTMSSLADRKQNCEELEKSVTKEEKDGQWLLDVNVDEIPNCNYDFNELPFTLLGYLQFKTNSQEFKEHKNKEPDHKKEQHLNPELVNGHSANSSANPINVSINQSIYKVL